MRYTEEYKNNVRIKIVTAAARAFRAAGIHGVSIPGIMAELGLTHGGFYAHFKDRDELVAAAIDFAAEQTGEAVFRAAPDLVTAVNVYLSPEHVADPGNGCVLAAVGVEAGRARGAVRDATARAAVGLIDRVAEKCGGGTADDDVLALVSQMVGAVVLARLVDDPTLRDRLLAAARLPN